VTFTTARRCCGVFVIPGAAYKNSDLLTYLISTAGRLAPK